MTLENVLNEIINSAKQEEGKIIKEAEAEAQRIVGEQRKSVEEEKGKALEKARKHAKEMKKKQLSAYTLEMKKQLMQEKAKALDTVVERTVAKIEGMKSAERKKLLGKLVNAAKQELQGSKFIYANKKDRKLLGSVAGLKFDGELNILGGVVLANADKSVQVDYSFERLLEEQKEKNLNEIAKKLFA